MEDASDFNFENVKACQVVVLTTIKHDKLDWQNTMELDRYRRQHAQKHEIPSDSKQQHSNFGPTKKQNLSEAGFLLCKFINDGKCSRQNTHLTRNVWYLHICSKCKGDHALRKCPSKN